eukprot:COSAG01_NODE_67333_length_267_cov_0.916667_1_plen_67_part_01
MMCHILAADWRRAVRGAAVSRVSQNSESLPSCRILGGDRPLFFIRPVTAAFLRKRFPPGRGPARVCS